MGWRLPGASEWWDEMSFWEAKKDRLNSRVAGRDRRAHFLIRTVYGQNGERRLLV